MIFFKNRKKFLDLQNEKSKACLFNKQGGTPLHTSKESFTKSVISKKASCVKTCRKEKKKTLYVHFLSALPPAFEANPTGAAAEATGNKKYTKKNHIIEIRYKLAKC